MIGTLLLALLLGAGRADWLLIQTDYATIHYQRSDSLAAEKLAQIIPPTVQRIERDLQLPRQPRFKVYLAPDRSTYDEISPGRTPPQWSVGWARPESGLIVLLSQNAARGEGRELLTTQVLVHELAHLMLHAKLGGRDVPRWLEEGYAKTAAREWSLGTATTLTWAVVRGRLIPLAQLVQRFPEDEPRVHLAYAQSQSFVAFLLDNFGPEGLGRFLELLAQGLPVEIACERALGRDIHALEHDWRRYLELHHTWLGLFLSRRWVWALTSLLMLFAAAISLVRRRRKLRAMELEERFEHDDDLSGLLH
ncbi:MAG: peptidase MA family metallohydrolase [Candidatus Alcyoniella australis]|nr:peptidase MA family metallohydrolase [Candidatus Alcyoniella australis]